MDRSSTWFRVALTAGALGLFGGSLAAQKVAVESDRGTDFTAFRTFTVGEVKLTSTNPILNSDLVKKAIATELEKVLVARGLKAVPAGGDVEAVIEFGAVTKEDIELVSGRGRGTGPQTIRTEVTTGTLIIDLRAGTGRSMVWRSVAVDQQNSAARFSDRYDDIVKKSFEKYPPKK